MSDSRFWTFIRILNVRLRFILLMVLVGLIAGNWENIINRVDRWRRPKEAASMVATQDVEYYCPMHPSVVRGEPGNCPICGMPLVQRSKTAAKVLPEGVLAQVQMSPQKVQMGRIATTLVSFRLLSREIRTVGIVDYDETRRAFIPARIKGRIDKLIVNYVGQHVNKGDALALIYSPDLLVAQEELLTATRTATQQKGQGELAETMAKTLVDAARRKLVLWGVTNEQIEGIIREGKPQTHLTIYSPISGIVTEKKVLEGHYVNEGDDLYTIADLSRVWMQAKIFENEIAGIKTGTAVEVGSVADPNEIFAGRVTFIAYTVDPETRTISARVEVDNPTEKLKPGMYVTAVIRLPVGQITPISPTTTRATTQPRDSLVTDPLAKAYLRVASAFAQDKSDAAAVSDLIHQTHGIHERADENMRARVGAFAELVGQLRDKDLKGQRDLFKTISKQTIDLLRTNPPRDQTLFIEHCPMVNADWLSPSEAIANPYYGSSMLTCGSVTGKILPASPAAEDERFAAGYYCPIYPDRLFSKAADCPLDKFPTKYVKVEKVLAVPESSVINTGTRRVAYRESGPGTFEMIEVKVEPRAGEFYPVIQGLKPGDRVVTDGAFVVDAENRLNPGAAGQYFGASGNK